KVYDEKTCPLAQFYVERGLRQRIDSPGGLGEVPARLESVVGPARRERGVGAEVGESSIAVPVKRAAKPAAPRKAPKQAAKKAVKKAPQKSGLQATLKSAL